MGRTVGVASFLALVAFLVVGALQVTRPAGVAALCVPFGFDTYEARQGRHDVTTYGTAIDLAAAGMAVNQVYSVGGESFDVRYQGLEAGPRSARQQASTSRTIPASIFKSMMWIEAGWEHGASSTPWGGVGPIKRADEPSGPCGYGLAQITSGMTNATGNANAWQAAVGSHYVLNLAEGARHLAGKWNDAPQFRPIAGEGNPGYLEDWYFAIWAYNGFAAQNHPLSNEDNDDPNSPWRDHPFNPFRDPLRGEVYHCGDPSAPNHGPANPNPANFTYPERVYGCMRYPPDYTPIGGSPTDMWAPQTFNMPDLDIPVISEAFKPEHFIDCYYADFQGGCAPMDFPTTIPDLGITPHTDTHGLPAPQNILGAPNAIVGCATSVTLTVVPGTSPPVSPLIGVRNAGTSVAPFRIRYSDPWIVVQRQGESPGRRMHAGVAIGTEITVNLPGGATQAGYYTSMVITVDPALLPAGSVFSGTVWIEPLLGGTPATIPVTVIRGQPDLPIDSVAPGMARDGG